MNRTQLINTIAKEAGLTKTQAGEALFVMIDTITSALKKDDNVTLIGFGSFKVSKRAARNARNPRTGKAVKVAARKAPRFKPGKALKEALN